MDRETEFNQAIAARIREARKVAGYSQEDLGAKINMSKVGFGHYERGTHLPGLWQMSELARILGKPVTWFLGIITQPGELTDDEQQLLSMYRRAKELDRDRVALAVLEGVIEES